MPQDKDLMARYKSFDDVEDLRRGIVAFEPHRIEIGPIYTHQPKLREKAIGVFETVERELIFDIDASDYDDIRVCCQAKKMCDFCWEFMVAGVHALDALLREDFGFMHLLWVFSGRRGIHCWVSDKKARKLTNSQRSAVAKYIEVHLGGVNLRESRLSVEKDLQGKTLHPSLRRILETQLAPAFQNIVLNPDNPNNLSVAKVADAILSIFQVRMGANPMTQRVHELLSKAVNHQMTPAESWAAIKKLKPQKGHSGYNPMEWVPSVVELMYTYPRLVCISF